MTAEQNSFEFRGLQTRTSRNFRTSRSASRWLRACTPEPRMASTEASARASASVATAEAAAVRISVIKPPVHRHERLSCFRTEKENHRMMRVHAFVVRIKGHQLGPERAAAYAGITPKNPWCSADRQDQPHRLLRLCPLKGHATRPAIAGISSSIRKCAADLVFAQKHRLCVLCLEKRSANGSHRSFAKSLTR